MNESPDTRNRRPPVLRSPRSVDLEITALCNLRCSYCYFFDNPAVPYRDLPAEEWLRFFEELGRCAVMRVSLQGGEPLMRRDFRELVDGIVRNRMRFSVLTNGTLVTEGLAAFIAATGRCDQVQVSIDGSCAAVHDRTRGPNSFERATRGLRWLQRHGVPVGVRVTVTRHNVDDLENTARFLLEELGIPRFGTNAAGYVGSCMRHAREVLLNVGERMRAMRALTALAERYPNRITATAGPLADANTWGRMEQARRDRAPAFDDGGRLTGCGCHFSSCAVRADGTLIPCVLLPHLEMGRVNRDPLTDVWRHHPVLEELRARSTIALSGFEHCRDCPYVPYCTGNCPALSHTCYGQVQHPSPDGCLRLFREQGGRLDGDRENA